MTYPIWLYGFYACLVFSLAFAVYGYRTQALRRPRYKFLSPLRIPPPEETRASIRRFHEAARRDELVDFVWHRFGPSGFAARPCRKRT